MPITATEWTAGSIDPDEQRPDPEPVSESTDSESVSESASPEGEVRSFLKANDQIAFSRAEIVRGAQCRVSKPAQLGTILANLPNQLADLAADFEAGGVEVAAYSDAVDRLRDAGEIQCSRIARSDGEPVIYYRIAKGETEAYESSSDCSP